MIPLPPDAPAWQSALRRIRQAGPRPLIACSGGADSVALAALCACLPSAPDWSPVLGHVNHHLRPDSDNDQRIALQTATRLGLPCRVVELDPSPILTHANGLEAGARQQRYDALCAMADDVGATAILTAHHAQDRLETALLHLAEGTGIRGLAGPLASTRWRREHGAALPVLRPLLELWPEDLRTWLGALGLPWTEDPSNLDQRFARNRLRAEVIPPFRAMARPAGLVRSLAQLAADADLLDQLLRPHLDDVVLRRSPGQVLIDRVMLAKRDLELRGALLLRLVGEVSHGRVDSRFVNELATRTPEKGTLTLLGHQVRAELSTRHIRIGGTTDPRTPLALMPGTPSG